MDKTAVTAIVARMDELTEDLASCENMLKEAHPGLIAHIRELYEELPGLRSQLKHEIRLLGPGTYDFPNGHTVQVKRPPMKKKVDLEGLLDRAREREELEQLLDAEVLVYALNHTQLQRLTGTLKSVYSSYVEESPGTSPVYLPPQFKE